MKRILLIEVPDPRLVPDDPAYQANVVVYRKTIEEALRLPLDREKGATIDEMRKSIRVLDAMDAAQEGVLILEDADWEHLKSKVERMPWGMDDRRIVRFYDDVVNATAEVKLPAPTEETTGAPPDGLAPVEVISVATG